MEDVPDLKNNLWKRQEQLDRWKTSEVNAASSEVRDREKSLIQFPDSFVFLAACSSFDEEEIRRLMEKGADINTANVDGLTALHQACIDDDLHRVKFLIDLGANLNAQDNEGWTPLHAAASCGYMDIAKYIIEKGANVAVVNNDAELPIDLAEGNEMTNFLNAEMSKQGIDAEAARNEEERVMLHDANQWLNNKSYDEQPHPKTGATALHVAAAKGYINVMKLLLQAGAPIEARDQDGWTPLHAAAHWEQEEACKILVENFCNMDAKNNSGQTAFDIADSDIVTYLEDLRKQQATMRKDQEEKQQQDVILRNSVIGRRRSSVTRLSTDQRQDLLSKNVEEERTQLERMRSQVPTLEEEEAKSESGNTSSDEPRSPAAIDSHSAAPSSEENKVETEKSSVSNVGDGVLGSKVRNTEVIGEIYGVQMRAKEKPRPAGTRSAVLDSPVLNTTNVVKSEPSTSSAVQSDSKLVSTTSASTASNALSTLPSLSRSSAPGSVNVAASKNGISGSSTVAQSVPVSTATASTSKAASGLSTSVSTVSASGTVPATQVSSVSSPSVSAAAFGFSGRLSGPVTSKAPPPSITAVQPTTVSHTLSSESQKPSVTGGLTLPAVKKYGIQPGATASDSVSQSISAQSSSTISNSSSVTASSTTTTSTAIGSNKVTPLPAAANVKDGGSAAGDRASLPISPPVSDASLNWTTNNSNRRSFEVPKRDVEKEVERKARARRAREERRSTQGVSKEDLEASHYVSGRSTDLPDGSVDRNSSLDKTNITLSEGRKSLDMLGQKESSDSVPLRRNLAYSDDRNTAIVRPEVTRPSSVMGVSSTSVSSVTNRPIDYRKLYEEEKLKNDKSGREMEKLRAELRETKADLDRALMTGRDSNALQSQLESRERRALERKISELEEEVKSVEALRAENQRLKQENGALIRVISKLSK